MTEPYQRYAIYWVPEEGSPLLDFGARWFANAFSAESGAGSDTFGLPEELAMRATKAPARYGIHATLKAPFRLKDGTSEAQLSGELAAFCSKRRRFVAGPLKPTCFQRYLGLVPVPPVADLEWLADECVTHFDRFRAPLDAASRSRRNEAGMTPTEAVLYEEFGYPYVLSTFEFHVSLAGPLGPDELEIVTKTLKPHIAFAEAPLRIESVCLLGESEGGGAFELIARYMLRR